MFPTVAEMVSLCDVVMAEGFGQRHALPQRTTRTHDEQCEFNAVKVRELLDRLSGQWACEAGRVQ